MNKLRDTRPMASSWWVCLVFALTVLMIGMIPGQLTFALDPDAAARIGLESIDLPAWVFIGAWLINYPAMGVASFLVWLTRGERDVSIPLSIFAAALLQTLMFWFTDSLRMTAVIDATGILFACVVAWVYSRYSTAAVWCLMPWVVWMPVTLGIKLWALVNGLR